MNSFGKRHYYQAAVRLPSNLLGELRECSYMLVLLLMILP